MTDVHELKPLVLSQQQRDDLRRELQRNRGISASFNPSIILGLLDAADNLDEVLRDARDALGLHVDDPDSDCVVAIQRLRMRLREKAHRVAELEAELGSRDVCWHCGDVLEPLPKPRCERCPDECDVEGCDAPGCCDVQGGAS